MNDRVATSQPGHSAASAHLLRSRISRVCVAIAASNPGEMIERATEAARENPFLEFRLDYLEDPTAGIPRIQQFLYELGEVTAIATCRREANGGRFQGTVQAELKLLRQAIAAGCDLIDVEIETAEQVSASELADLRSLGAGLILSFHDFKATRDLDRVFERIRKFDPEFIKIVSTATSLADNVTMMRFLERTSDAANMVGICMGEQGIISRILGVRAGSCFTFASAHTGEETAPGQIAARTLHEIYRIDQVSTATRVYGVVGNPVAHSLSPLIHNLAFRRETVNAVFLALQANKLSDVLTLVRDVPLHGLAVTMPFKAEILKHLSNTDPLSEKIGACNTVVRAQNGNLYGFNTDVAAVVRPLERRLPLKGAKVLVVGAGGAARAAVFGLVDKGADVTIVNRTHEAAQKLARQAKARTIRYEQLSKASFDVILNSTPVGMHGNKVRSWLTPDQLNARLVFDMVYNPIETPLLRMAREKGLPVVTGVEMFVNQGARQFEIWTGKPAPEDEMLRAVVHRLRQRAENSPAAGESSAQHQDVFSAKRLSVAAAALAKAEPKPEPKQEAKPEPKAASKAESVRVSLPVKAATAKSSPSIKPAAAPVRVAEKPKTVASKPPAAAVAPSNGHAAATAVKSARPKPALKSPVRPPLRAKPAVKKAVAPAKKSAKPASKSKPAVSTKSAKSRKPASLARAKAKPAKAKR